MSGMFTVLIALALLAVLGVLMVGVVTMAKGGEFNSRHANRLMRLRVALQLGALVLIVIAFLARDG